MKVSVIGAGNVGATCADAIAFRSIASEVVLLDIRENFAEGKALDMMQTATSLILKLLAAPTIMVKQQTAM